MMQNALINVSIRQGAIFLPSYVVALGQAKITEATAQLVQNVNTLGYTFSEQLLHAFNGLDSQSQKAIWNELKEITGINSNWTPLVKNWLVPTGETRLDHLKVLVATVFQQKGTRLACGHIIPPDSFQIERYNGCPFCGTPFEMGQTEFIGQGTKLKELILWTETELDNLAQSLLTSKTPLDATQIDSLKHLLAVSAVPTVHIEMKETVVTVLNHFFDANRAQEVQHLITSPADILRFLWYRNTGSLLVIQPKVIKKRTNLNRLMLGSPQWRTAKQSVDALKLKYNRTECAMVANWLNNLPMSAETVCEIMHPKRNIWVRFIRALRLAEYSQKKGFENLRTLMDVFYNQTYTVWQGQVETSKLKDDADSTMALLKMRPGLFARSLFANMVWFGTDKTVPAFAEIIDKVPARLVLTLNMYAPDYFGGQDRLVAPLGGTHKSVKPNKYLVQLPIAERADMVEQVKLLTYLAMGKRFSLMPTQSKTMFIEPSLFRIPLAIGDRSKTVHDRETALSGTRFAVEGDSIRLFMQWGKGMPAQHLDMDLSCSIAYTNKVEICSYSQLTNTGCKHSGDIRSIPNQVGTAEYIEINLNELAEADAKYVTFTCNAYSSGAITPNLMLGWMDSKNKMKISESSGVAYDPSCVQHVVRVNSSLAKGLVFGVLDVQAREILWLEMEFGGQIVQNMCVADVMALIRKLDSKTSVGELLRIKAEAQQITIVDSPDADEVYDMLWAKDTAAVSQLLVD